MDLLCDIALFCRIIKDGSNRCPIDERNIWKRLQQILRICVKISSINLKNNQIFSALEGASLILFHITSNLFGIFIFPEFILDESIHLSVFCKESHICMERGLIWVWTLPENLQRKPIPHELLPDKIHKSRLIQATDSMDILLPIQAAVLLKKLLQFVLFRSKCLTDAFKKERFVARIHRVPPFCKRAAEPCYRLCGSQFAYEK